MLSHTMIHTKILHLSNSYEVLHVRLSLDYFISKNPPKIYDERLLLLDGVLSRVWLVQLPQPSDIL